MKISASKLARRVALALVVALLAAIAALTGGSLYMIDYAMAPDANRRDIDSAYALLYERVPDMRPWVDSLNAIGALRDTQMVAPDGRRLHALWLRGDSARGRTAIVVHGWRDCAVSYMFLGRMYHRDLGMNVLMPDLHAHGLSDGESIRMGWGDHRDVLLWAELAEGLFGDSVAPSRMVVHGVSMGAATTMCMSGDSVPSYVRCFVADCGYTSVWDQFKNQLREQFGLPAFPLLHACDHINGWLYGWRFGDASPLRQMSRCHKPMLFIHGGDDHFVPTAMVFELYDAKPSPKSLWIAPGSGHACSYGDHVEEYTERVSRFVDAAFRE